MLPYFIILALVMFLIYVNKSENSSIEVSGISIFLSFLILTLFAGFRSSNIGTDTNNYVSLFNELKYIYQLDYNSGKSIEKGYLFFQEIAFFISKDYWSLLTLIALLCVACNFIVIKKLSMNIQLSIFIYITLGEYFGFFNGARQGMAVAISAISLLYIIKKDFIRFAVCIFIASLFHRSAMVFFPFYFILRIPFTIKNALIFSVLGYIAFSFFRNIISLFNTDIESRYAGYENRGAIGGQFLALFFIVTAILLILLRNKIKIPNLKLYDVYLNLCLFTAIIYMVVIVTGSDVNFIRISSYFSIGFILIWPLIFKDINLFNINLIKVLFVVIHLFFYGISLYKMSNLTPYQLNPNFL